LEDLDQKKQNKQQFVYFKIKLINASEILFLSYFQSILRRKKSIFPILV